jgi:hypothetical protein
VRAYVELLLRLTAARSQRLTDVAGYSLGAACAQCAAGATARNESHPPKCRRCGAHWPVEAVETLRDGRRSKRSGAQQRGDGALMDLCTFGSWLARLPSRDRSVYLVYLDHGRDACAAKLAITPYAVRSAVRRARECLQSHIDRAGYGREKGLAL